MSRYSRRNDSTSNIQKMDTTPGVTQKPASAGAEAGAGTGADAVSAFTLVELLTVIVIIGILAAILIPTVSKVREYAASATTLGNLRQLAMAARLHATDNKGFVPGIYSNASESASAPEPCWANKLVLDGYLGGPALAANDFSGARKYYTSTFTNPWIRSRQKLPMSDYKGTLSMNSFKGDLNKPKNLELYTQNIPPGRLVLFADGAINATTTNTGWNLRDTAAGGAVSYPNSLMNGRAHYAFSDGSTRRIQAQTPDAESSPPVGLDETVFFYPPN
jgi:general secretion pathway protein G